jgi:hypothetical protein
MYFLHIIRIIDFKRMLFVPYTCVITFLFSFISRTEEEIEVDNLKEVKVPEEYIDKFNDMDKLYLEDGEKKEAGDH